MNVKEQRLTGEQHQEFNELMKDYNNLEFNMLKVVEEATETNELLLKYVTKIPELRPNIKDIVEEVGDLMARVHILCIQMGIQEAAVVRTESKIAYIYEMAKKKQYGTKVLLERQKSCPCKENCECPT